MGLISRVSSRTYRKMLILKLSVLSLCVFGAEKKRNKRIEGISEKEFHDLHEQWDDEDIEDGLVDEMDLPEHKREKRQLPMDVIMKDPQRLDKPTQEDVMWKSKHRTLMIFVDIVEKDFWLAKKEPRSRPWSTRKFAEDISAKWETMLHNSHELGIMRFQPDDDQILFKLDDGSRAYAIKDFLVEQEEVIHVSIEKTSYYGKGDRIVNYKKHQVEKEKKKNRDDAIRKKKEEIKKRITDEKKAVEEKLKAEAEAKKAAEMLKDYDMATAKTEL